MGERDARRPTPTAWRRSSRCSPAGSPSGDARPATRRQRRSPRSARPGATGTVEGHAAQGLRGRRAASIDEARQADREGARSARPPACWGIGATRRGDDRRDHRATRAQFTIPALAPGTHTLVAIDGEHAPARSAPITRRRISPVTGVEITMKAGGTLAGTRRRHRRQAGAVRDRARRRRRASRCGSGRRAPGDDATSAGAFELRGLARAKLQARAESETAASKIATSTSTDAGREARTSSSCSTSRARSPASSSTRRAQPVPEVQVNAFPDILGGGIDRGPRARRHVVGDHRRRRRVHDPRPARRRVPAVRPRARPAAATTGASRARRRRPATRTCGSRSPAPGSSIGKIVLEGGDAPPKLASVQIGYQAARRRRTRRHVQAHGRHARQATTSRSAAPSSPSSSSATSRSSRARPPTSAR